ncbi:ATP-binding cassette domain-containing protein [Paenibacillus eucommiae]|uniref:ABC-type multidrug transport system ATPase subunit n=1 Tax=Paenibacillus eucommiae TaxID=1355755 RepID=A0ABS4J949_9BACL|nr:ABC transporter ATP-binding protein [Paenibacillus eucommiae]MBP1996365.1 ABC-type multidrug transport system ATPase subunit [Paenibacillus eucommiae]
MTAVPLVTLADITKKYSSRLVLSSVSLTIHSGQTLILQGSNGSGKSTLIKIIGGFIDPTSGQRIVSGLHTPFISYMPDRFPKHRFSSMEYLMHMGSIQRIEKNALKQRILELHSLFRLKLDDQPMRYFSKGMLQKVNMMQAALSKPDLLLLDEPFSGLDAATMIEMVNVLEHLKKQHVTIVISTHELHLLEQLADRMITVKDASLFESNHLSAAEATMLIVCKFPELQQAHHLFQHPSILSSYHEHGATYYRVNALEADTLLLAILQAGGSIIEVTKKG